MAKGSTTLRQLLRINTELTLASNNQQMKLDNMLDLKVPELVNNNKCPSKSLEFLTNSNNTLDLDRMDIKGTS